MLQHLVLAAALSGSSSEPLSQGCYGAHGGHGMAGAQPMYVNAAVSGGGTKLKIQVFRMEYVTETRERTKSVKDKEGNNREVRETYAIMVPKTVAREIEQELDKVQGLDHEGKKLSAKTLASRLAKMTPVLASYNQEGLDSAYYRMLKPGATVLVFPLHRPMVPNETPKVQPKVSVDAGADFSPIATTYYNRSGPAGRLVDLYKRNSQTQATADGRMPAFLMALVGSDMGMSTLPLSQFVGLWSEPVYATIGLGTGTIGEKRDGTEDLKGPRGGQPPALSGASIDEKDLLHLQDSTTNNFDHEVDVKEKVKVGDAWEERTVNVKIKNTSFTVNKQSMPAKHVRAHDLNGKAIDAKALASRLRKFTAVLESIDGKNVDPYYLQLFKEGTIVLVPPMFSHYGGGTVVMPVPAEKTYPAPKKKSKAPNKNDA